MPDVTRDGKTLFARPAGSRGQFGGERPHLSGDGGAVWGERGQCREMGTRHGGRARDRSLKPQRLLNRALRFLPARQLLDIRHPALEVRVVVER